jgi:hypothetical protein
MYVFRTKPCSSEDRVDDQHHAAWSQAAIDQAVMDMAPVGGENGLAADQPAGDGQHDIEEGQRESDQRGGHAQQGEGLARPNDAVAAKQETDEEASAVPQEDGGRAEIVTKKAKQATRHRQRGAGQRAVALE